MLFVREGCSRRFMRPRSVGVPGSRKVGVVAPDSRGGAVREFGVKKSSSSQESLTSVIELVADDLVGVDDADGGNELMLVERAG